MTQILLDRRRILLSSAVAASLAVAPHALAARLQSESPSRRRPFDGGWLFRRGLGEGLEFPGLDDRGWRPIDLPHDWSVEDLPDQGSTAKGPIGPFDPKAEGGGSTGFTVGGEGWYRKHFRLAKPQGGRVEILFDGAYLDSQVWINGVLLGAHGNGYTPFAYDLIPHLSASGENVLAVRVRNLGQNTRWYAGSGLYRHVWLDVLPEQARIARWGVGVVTQRLMAEAAQVEVTATLRDVGARARVQWRMRDDRGRLVAQAEAPANDIVRATLSVPFPRPWSPDAPTLYSLETELVRDGQRLDQDFTLFGVRIVTFDARQGMLVNGAPTKLRGGCIHHDHGILGAASFDTAEDRKVRLLKARGYNAVRPSHNPFSRAFLEACDRHGLMVVAETFDVWRRGKKPLDYAVKFDAHWRDDLEVMVLSARNHPSIVMWSIGNEIPDRNTPDGVELQWRLANAVRALDPSRPVTAGLHEFLGRTVTPSEKTARPGRGGIPDQTSAVFLNVAGYNYKLRDYETDHRAYPERVLFGTESYPGDVFAIWDLTERSPWLVGDFVWTAMDHLGEVAIGGRAVISGDAKMRMAPMVGWPWISNDCGDLDLIGGQKAPSYARDVAWGLSPLEMAVQRPVPDGEIEVLRLWGWSDEWRSWNWPGAEGKPLAVRVYTPGDRVELRLNGKLVAAREVLPEDLKHIELRVPYAPGVLEAVAFRQGRQIGRKRLETVGAPSAIRLKPEIATAGSGRGDIAYLGVEIVDGKGRAIPELARKVTLEVSGPAELIAFGSGNPQASGSFQSLSAVTWDARALAVFRGRGRSGVVTVTATGEGLQAGKASLRLG
jgi:beta-galactosidase